MSYITFKTIGESGNLGSQVQQYASLYAIAKHNNKTIAFPESSLTSGYGLRFAELLDIPIQVLPDNFFKDFVDIRPNDKVIVDSAMFNLDQPINYNIVNRFDLYHYWYPNYLNDILDWKWNHKHERSAESSYFKIKKADKQTVALHVRRGDYLLPQHSHFCRLDNQYYSQALSTFFEEIDKYQFVIFSNDIQWCRDNLIEESDFVHFVEPGNDYEDLILMSMCDHQIIANSSYSWWAALKNENKQKKVLCPTNYLRNHSPWSHINGHYYPLDWINIDNEA
jgi:hypothetical protein